MPAPRPARRLYTTQNAAVDASIGQLVGGFPDEFDRGLLKEMMVSVYRLGQDRASTGDLKILNAALKELRYAFNVMRPYRNIRKVAMFGSARLKSQHPAYALGKEFGLRMAKSNWMVITGAASGIMKAGHEGAGREASVGLNIRLPFEQGANTVIAQDRKLITCKYFFTRKLLFIKESHATALFPGGFGTLDEGFESLTLVQTGKSDPRPIVFVDTPRGSFWQPMIKFFEDRLVKRGMISSSDQSVYQVARSAEDAARQILQFYRTYHSIRYVGDKLAIRLQQKISEADVARLSEEFGDILTAGSIRQAGALAEEADEPQIQQLPRLVLRYNRKDYGRLIQLIHRINRLPLVQPAQSG